MIEVRPLHTALAAEISGVSLGHLSEADFARVHAAFLERLTIVFREQKITPAQQVAFTERFGPAQPHPLGSRVHRQGFPQVLVLENKPGRAGARNDFWHSDISFAAKPPQASILYALRVTEGVGDTLFANMYAAYDRLPAGMKARLEGLSAFHSSEKLAERARQAAGSDARPIDSIPRPAQHPVIRRHPETGRPALYVNPYFTTRFAGMNREQSRPLIDDLTARATVAANVYRHRWRAGDVVMWDNRCVMHYAEYDYDDSRPRLMNRTTAG